MECNVPAGLKDTRRRAHYTHNYAGIPKTSWKARPEASRVGFQQGADVLLFSNVDESTVRTSILALLLNLNVTIDSGDLDIYNSTLLSKTRVEGTSTASLVKDDQS